MPGVLSTGRPGVLSTGQHKCPVDRTMPTGGLAPVRIRTRPGDFPIPSYSMTV
jgi:hypothetical protein